MQTPRRSRPPTDRWDRRPLRTYVVLAYPLAGAPAVMPAALPVGTVVAATLDGARHLARSRWWYLPVRECRAGDPASGRKLGRTRAGRTRAGRSVVEDVGGPADRPGLPYVLRVRRASACRTAWLVEALARDGAAAQRRARGG